MIKQYKKCIDLCNYTRRESCQVNIGCLSIGSSFPVMVQSMATVDTNNTIGATEQAIKIFDAGGECVRFTAQGTKEAKNLANIRKELDLKGYKLPLVADIHLNPKAAFEAVLNVEKVRINPGNFIDKRAKFEHIEYTEPEYKEELERLESKFGEFLDLCTFHNRSIRVGVNHGSLSDRIMSRYGDTPSGMVESAMEFLRVCKGRKFDNVVVSMKSSNTATMIIAYRMLCGAMANEGMNYPLHLGVTEAGEGSDGRIRSAVGIGALLNDGIGDTIRVSLTEPPENEIPVAQILVDYYNNRALNVDCSMVDYSQYEPFKSNRENREITKIVVDISNCDKDIDSIVSQFPNDYLYIGEREFSGNCENIIKSKDRRIIEVDMNTIINNHSFDKDNIIVVCGKSPQEQRAICLYIKQLGIANKTIIKQQYNTDSTENLEIWASADFGGLMIDGFGDAIWIDSKGADNSSLSLSILQASRRRFSKAEYISCPGCGRTLYDLQGVVKQIKEQTKGVKNIKLAVMGCIVNGPGEMADADYGYVGAGVGVVAIYKGKEMICNNIPQEIAIEKLIELIKENGDWRC